MTISLPDALRSLKDHEPELRRRGVTHAAVFGSVARGEQGASSDVDILVELDENGRLDLFDYVNIKLFIGDLLGGRVDVANRKTLKRLLRHQITSEAVDAF
jgi:predicted nucleotidyltransferase